MRKKKKILISFFIISLIIVLAMKGKKYIENYNLYSNILSENWNLKISENYEQVYSKDSGESFLGDGKRYHVFKYNDNEVINKNFDWKSEKNLDIELQIQKILNDLDINKEQYPNFIENYKYYESIDHTSKLYIIYFENEGIVYIIEDIY